MFLKYHLGIFLLSHNVLYFHFLVITLHHALCYFLMKPLLSGHLTGSRGWPLNRGSTVIQNTHMHMHKKPKPHTLNYISEGGGHLIKT